MRNGGKRETVVLIFVIPMRLMVVCLFVCCTFKYITIKEREYARDATMACGIIE